MGIKTEWDYTDRARFYDRRADYDSDMIDEIVRDIGLRKGDRVADLGAGTGKLTKELLRAGLRVDAVEPNDAMRSLGIKNTKGGEVAWSVGTGEETGLEDNTYRAVFFGSSFNVVDQPKASKETARILKADGWFCCMWNHRDLDDPLQREIEDCIKNEIDGYNYGSRRENPTEVLKASNLFSAVKHVTGTVVWELSRDEVMEAWRSHETLARNAGDKFDFVCNKIAEILAGHDTVVQPFTNRAWYSQRA